MGTNKKLCCNDLLAPRYKLQPVMDSIYIAEGQNLNFGSVVDCKGFLCDSTHLEPYAILYEDCDTTKGAQEANVLIMGEFNIEKLVFGADATGDVLDKIVFYAKKNGIIIRPYDYAPSFTPPEVSGIEKVIPEGTSTENKLINETDLNEATSAWNTGYTPKGPASVSTINGLTGQSNGDRYVLTDGGTLTDGSVVVAAGDEVAWDATNSAWYKVNQYALEQFGTNKIKYLTNTATESDLTSGNYFALDGSAGTKKLNSTTLLTKTAQNALAGSVAQEFDSTRTSENPYIVGQQVIYNGIRKMFIHNHYGAWNGADATNVDDEGAAPLEVGKRFSLVGANLIVQYAYIPISLGVTKVLLKASPNPWPTDTVGGSNTNILIVYADKSDGTSSNLRQYSIAATIPDEIELALPENTRIVRIFFRANSGSKVEFEILNVVAIQDLKSAVASLANNFSGNFLSTKYYGKDEFVINNYALLRAKENVTPGAFDSSKWSSASAKDVASYFTQFAVNGGVLYIPGNGINAIVRDFGITSNSKLHFSIANPNWSVTSLTSDLNKLAIRGIRADGTTTNLAQFLKDAAVPSSFDFYVNSNVYVGYSVFVRADVGEFVELSVKVNSESWIVPARAFFEMGNISISSSSMSYSNSTSRARTKKDKFIKLSKGDLIEMDEGYRMFLGYSSNGEPPYTSVYWTNFWKVQTDCKAVILISKTDDSTSNIDELMSHIKIISSTSELNPSISMPEVAEEYAALECSSRYDGQVAFTLSGSGSVAVTKKFTCRPGTMLRVELGTRTWGVSSLPSADYNKLCIRKVTAGGTTSNLVQVSRDVIPSDTYVVKMPSDAVAFDVFFRADVGESVSFVCKGQPYRSMRVHEVADIVHSVNHRGYNSLAPENTIPAFQESARQGFKEVETDVWSTSDGHIVCIHDLTVDRTSDGTGTVSQMTLEQLKELDFGSWFSPSFAGTKIPTLEEFLAACRKLGLSAYIEIKGVSSVETALNIVHHYGMERKVTWISFGLSYLQSIVNLDKMARVGYLLNEITQSDVTAAVGLRTGYNEVFIDAANSAVDETSLALLNAAGMPVEQWTADEYTIKHSYPAVSGFTSNSAIAADILYGTEIID